MNLTRKQTVLIEQGRNLDFWRLLNDFFPAEGECGDMYDEIDSEYQELEDIVESETVYGLNENNETYTVVPYTNRKPPVSRPTWPF